MQVCPVGHVNVRAVALEAVAEAQVYSVILLVPMQESIREVGEPIEGVTVTAPAVPIFEPPSLSLQA